MKFTFFTTALLLCFSQSAFAQDLDLLLNKIIQREKLKPLVWTRDISSAKFRLGSMLFVEKELSGNRNISCKTCHHPMLGTGDELPLSIGEGGSGEGKSRQLGTGRVIARNAPPLFNLGFVGNTQMFFDGRVSYDWLSDEFTTPEPLLNGPNPKLSAYTEILSNALSAQALFPPTNHDEMRGMPGSNTIADAKNNKEVWELLTERIISIKRYEDAILKAYPDLTNMDQVNFAHLAEALGHFQANLFAITDTPFDKYVAGDKSALTDAQKRGAIEFFGPAKCFECHSGMNFTDNKFHNIGWPQIGPGKDANRYDKGRFLTTNDPKDLYAFKTPTLRNVVHTAPYGHNGALRTLEQVIDHYTHPMRANHHYNPGFQNLPYQIDIELNSLREKMQNIDPILGIQGTPIPMPLRKDIIEFLKSISK